MPKLMLADLSDGIAVQTLAYLKQKRLIPYKNKPGAFLVLTLADRTGVIEGKVFDGAEELAEQLPEGRVISIRGRASTYQNVLGLVLEQAEIWEGPVNAEDFLAAYPGDVAALKRQLDALIASIRDPDLLLLIRSIFSDPDIRDKYCDAPAGKGMHGAYLHGLLEHVVRQAALAEAACTCYPQANRDLVIAGVLLHDIGKIHEFAWKLSIDYTPLGRLLGHIVIGDRMVYERGRELGISEETAMRLQHLILSHHGEREMGAAVLPQILEAVILHSVDNLEAKATHCIEMLQTGEPDAAWSEYDRIESRFWYRGTAATPTHAE
ncbi:MAG: 3'-5' exoribonuclease YhaM family protein [Armatimonadota bacterium]